MSDDLKARIRALERARANTDESAVAALVRCRRGSATMQDAIALFQERTGRAPGPPVVAAAEELALRIRASLAEMDGRTTGIPQE